MEIPAQKTSDEQRIRWLRAWMHAISQPRNGEHQLFVKLDAWHALDLPILRRAFPDTPWIFLYRDPVEVMVSAMKAPGMHLAPNLIDMNIARVAPEDAQRMTQAQYAVHILALLLRRALDLLGPEGGKALDYRSLPESIFTEIAPHFGLSLNTGLAPLVGCSCLSFHSRYSLEYRHIDTSNGSLSIYSRFDTSSTVTLVTPPKQPLAFLTGL